MQLRETGVETAACDGASAGGAQHAGGTAVVIHYQVRLAAYSGKADDYSSDARRQSLAPALAIRSCLVSKGIAIYRFDVLVRGI